MKLPHRSLWCALVLLLPLTALGCAGTPDPAAKNAADLDDLRIMMTGYFSSAQQAADDPRYFDIQLVMVPIWAERDDGYWLYVEQAVADATDRPYRQRVYHLSVQGDDTAPLRSDVYTLPGDPLDFAGAWKTLEGVAMLEAMSPDDLTLREGCAIHLTRLPSGVFAGETRGKGCASSLGDADYATSEVEIGPSVLTSWDRGFTTDGEQAWGAEAGPYRFVLENGGPGS